MSETNEPDAKRFPWVLRQSFRLATAASSVVPIVAGMIASSRDPANMDAYMSVAGFASGLIACNGCELAGSRGANFGKRVSNAFNSPNLAKNLIFAALVPITAVEIQFH